jgi:hypothetical protein
MLRRHRLSLVALPLVCACGGIVQGGTGRSGGNGGNAPVDAAVDGQGRGPCVRAHRVVPTTNTPQALVTDATHLYWFDDAAGGAAVYVTDKCAAGSVTPLASLTDAGVALAEDATSIYVTTRGNNPSASGGGLFAIAKAGGTSRRLVDAPMGADGVAAANGWVYWTENDLDRVGRVRPDGTGAEYLPPIVHGPARVAVLPDSSACVLGQGLSCLLPSGAVVSAPVSRPNPAFLSSDGHAVYLAGTDPAGAWAILRVTVGATLDVQTLADDPGDAGGAPPLSGVVAPSSRGVYVVYGTGTLRWIPGDGSAPVEEVIAQTLPPFLFYADADGLYWDALNGLEIGPPLGT